MYTSFGYKNFISKKINPDNKQSYLEKLHAMSEDKALCTTYKANNLKIKKKVQMDNDRQQLIEVVDELKKKIVKWRTRTYDDIPSFQSLTKNQSLLSKLQF